MQEDGIEVTPEMIKAGEHVYDLRDVMPADATFDKEKWLNQDSQYALTTLWDMLRNYLPFYEIAADLERLLGRATHLGDSPYYRVDLKDDDQDVNIFQDLLAAIQRACEEHGMSHTAELATRAAGRKTKTHYDIRHVLIHLNDSLTSELEREAIFRIPPERNGYYEQDDLFGPEVAAAFPSCERDIRKAGSCYALGQEDACVHHLMMVLERGLNALAVRVCGVPYQGVNWQVIIDKIAKELAGHQLNSADRKFYREVNAQFGFLKVAYRNYSMHAYDDKYDMAKALHIFNQACTFMQKLAQGGLTE